MQAKDQKEMLEMLEKPTLGQVSARSCSEIAQNGILAGMFHEAPLRVYSMQVIFGSTLPGFRCVGYPRR